MRHESDAILTRARLARLDKATESTQKAGTEAKASKVNSGPRFPGDARNSLKRSSFFSPDMSLFLGRAVSVNKRRRTEKSTSSSKKASADMHLPHDSKTQSTSNAGDLLINPFSSGSLIQPRQDTLLWNQSLSHEPYSLLRLLDDQRDAINLSHTQVPRVGSSAHINRLVAEYAPLEESSGLILNLPSRMPSLTPGFDTPLSSPPHSLSQVYNHPAWLTSSLPPTHPSQVAALPQLPVAPPFLSSCTPSSSEALDSRPVTPKRAFSQLPAVQDAMSPISQVSNPAVTVAEAAALYVGGLEGADLADVILPAGQARADQGQGLYDRGNGEERGHAELDDILLLEGDSWQISGSTRRAMEQWLHEGQGTTEGGASARREGKAIDEGDMEAGDLHADVGPFDWLEDLVGAAAVHASKANDDVPDGSNHQQQHQVLPQWILEELEEDGEDWRVVKRAREGEGEEDVKVGEEGQEEKTQVLVRSNTTESSTAGVPSFTSARSSLQQSRLSPQESRKEGRQEGGKIQGGSTMLTQQAVATNGLATGGGDAVGQEEGEGGKPWDASVGSVGHGGTEEGFGESEDVKREQEGEGEGEVGQPFERSFSTEWMKDLMSDPNLFGSFAGAGPAAEEDAGEEGSNEQIASKYGSGGPISAGGVDEWSMAAFMQTLGEGLAASTCRSSNRDRHDNTISML